jgi:hypothetical protein
VVSGAISAAIAARGRDHHRGVAPGQDQTYGLASLAIANRMAEPARAMMGLRKA